MDIVTLSILALFMVLLIAVGYVCSRHQNSLDEFFLAGRNIPTWAAAAAIVATETSAITFIGAPAISYGEGGDLSFLQICMGYVVARFLLASFFLPKIFTHELLTIYEYLGAAFGGPVQRVAQNFFFVTRALAAGVRHYAAALVLSAITPMDLYVAIFVTGAVSLAYSFLGGLSAIIWTEVLQLAVMIAGALLAFYSLWEAIPGGLETVNEVARTAGKLSWFHWDWSGTGAYSFIAGFIGGMCLNLASHGADQDLAQRLLSCRNLRSAQTAIVGSGIFIFAQFALFLYIGLMLFAFYQGEALDDLEKADQILPYYVIRNMSPVASALVIAGILSAALSSTASALNSLSSTAIRDVSAWLSKETMAMQQILWLSRGLTVFWTVVLILIALVASQTESILNTGLSIPSYTYGSLLAAFILAIFLKVRNVQYVIEGMFFGVIAVLLIANTGVQWTWYVPTGLVSACAYVVLGSWMERKHEHDSE